MKKFHPTKALAFVAVLAIFALLSINTAKAQIYNPEGLNIPGLWNGWQNPPANNLAFASATQVANGRVAISTSGTSKYQTIVKVAATGGDVIAGTYEFSFTSGSNSNFWANKWGGVTVAKNTIQNYTFSTSVANNSIVLTDAKWYTFNWENLGYVNNRAIVMETSGEPVIISNVVHSPVSVTITDPVTVNITLNTSKSVEELIYVRYTTNNFTTSTLVEASFTNTIGSAIIPAQEVGVEVKYYIFSTTIANPSADYDLLSIRIKDNNGTPFQYTVNQTLDLTAPTLMTLNPADNAVDVEVSTDLLITFSEAIQKGVGNILIMKTLDNTVVQTIDVSSQSVTLNNMLATINPDEFAHSTDYYVVVPAGAFKDLSNNDFAGILTATDWNFTTAAGTINYVDWCNLQWPASISISAGQTADIYAQVYESGVTNGEGQGAGITAWIGYSETNTNPDTWTNWVAATYFDDNSDLSNDEYKLAIGSTLSSGTYYYASRFQIGSTAYKYGGFVGGFWDGTTNVSGVLTVNPLPNVELFDFTLSGNPSNFTFAPSQYLYESITVPTEQANISVTATLQDASITVNGEIVESGVPSSAISLQQGIETTITVHVEKTGYITKDYVLKVTRNIGAPSIVLSSNSQLTETNLNGNNLILNLENTDFVDNVLVTSNFVLNNAPQGLSIESVMYMTSNSANILLTFDGTDFDSDISNLTLTVLGVEINSAQNLTSNSVSIICNFEAVVATSENGEQPDFNELTLNNYTFHAVLSGALYIDNINASNFDLLNAPDGLVIGSVSKLTENTATIILNYNGNDFDVNKLFSMVAKANGTDAANDIVSPEYTIASYTETVVAQNVGGGEINLVETNLNSFTFELLLDGANFNNGIDIAGFELINAPNGLTISNVLKTSEITVSVTFAYDGSDFDSNIIGFAIKVLDVVTSTTTDLQTPDYSINATVEAPLFLSADVPNISPAHIVALFSEPVTGTESGFTISIDGTTTSISGFEGINTNTLTFIVPQNILYGQQIMISYNAAQGNITNLFDVALLSFNAQEVINNVQEIVAAQPTDMQAIANNTNLILLSWTDNSYNESSFEIQRKVEPSGYFEMLANVFANVSTYSDYACSPNTTYSYRVRANNSAGSSTWSNIATAETFAVGVDNQYITDVTVYPNPTSGKLNISINSKSVGNSEMEIFDIRGVSLLQTIITSQSFMADLSNMGKGIYLIKLTIDSNIIWKKVVKN